MKLETVPVTGTIDRLATPEEVRAAVPLLSDQMIDPRFEIVCEIPADTGGYTRISEEDLEAIAAREVDPAWTDYLEYWSHVLM